MFFENLRIALRAIFANKMRSILTVLGIMIGVAAVIAVVSLVQGLQFQISKQLENVGSTFIRVVPDFSRVQRNPFLAAPKLTYEDAVAVRKGASTIRDFTPLFINNAVLKYRDAQHSATLIAVNQSYQEVVKQFVEHGRFFTSLDEEAKKRVVVLGPEAARLLGIGTQVGVDIRVGQNTFTVIGIMEKRGSGIGNDPDDVVYMPFATAQVLYGPQEMQYLPLALQVRSQEQVDLAKEQVREILRTRHHLKKDEPDDFNITTQEELMKTISGVLTSTSVIMGAVVGIALLVGGIGIMNIMLVSVTERTREIGVRKSIGARRRDVLVQFLVEAIALSGLGGAIGVAGGWLLATTTQTILNHSFPSLNLPPAHTPLWAIALAVGFCAFLGIIFGIYPAAK